MGYIIKLSLSNLNRRRLRTWLTIIGVMIGTASMVIMITAAIGAKKTLYEQLEMMESTHEIHVFSDTVSRKDRLLTDELVVELEKIHGVENVYPVLEFVGQENLSGYVVHFPITGVTADYMAKIQLESGSYPESKGMRPELIVGKGATGLFYNYEKNLKYTDTAEGSNGMTDKKLDFIYSVMNGYYVSGDMSSGNGSSSNVSGDKSGDDRNSEERIKLRVAGETSNPYDYRIYTDMETLKLLLRRNVRDGRIPGQPLDKNGNPYKVWVYSEIIVEVGDTADIAEVSDIISNMGFQAENSKETLDNLNRMTGIISVILGVIGAVAAIVAVIGIINTMSTAVYDRINEIGLLKMLGSDNYDISFMFLFESGLLGFMGGVLGVGLSYISDIILNKKFCTMLGFAEGTEIFVMPSYVMLAAVAGAVFVSVLAGAIPAARAARIAPLTALLAN